MQLADADAAGQVVAPHRRAEQPGDLRGDDPALAHHRDEEGERLHQVGCVLEEALAFGERLVDQPDLALLQVAQTTVNQLRGFRGGARGEVVTLDERGAKAAGRRVEHDPRTRDAATDDDHVEGLGAQRLQ